MSEKLKPFIWLDNNIEEVFDFYKSIFKDAKIISQSSFSGTIEIFGQNLIFLNGGPMYKLTTAFSLMISCDNQEETDYYWDAITKEGKESHCGWCEDKYGVTWQVTPSELPKLLSHPDKETAQYAHNAMMKMGKIIIKDLYQH